IQNTTAQRHNKLLSARPSSALIFTDGTIKPEGGRDAVRDAGQAPSQPAHMTPNHQARLTYCGLSNLTLGRSCDVTKSLRRLRNLQSWNHLRACSGQTLLSKLF